MLSGPALKVIVRRVEILDHVIDLVIEPGRTHGILAKAHLPAELREIHHLPVVAAVNLRAVATRAVLEMQVFTIVDIGGQHRTRQ